MGSLLITSVDWQEKTQSKSFMNIINWILTLEIDCSSLDKFTSYKLFQLHENTRLLQNLFMQRPSKMLFTLPVVRTLGN